VADLAGFLLNLSTSPTVLARFRKNPRAEMSKAGLTTSEQRALASGNAARIRLALGIRFAGRGKAQ
jgi:hypothetical protein